MDVLNMQTALPPAGENPSEWDGEDVADLLGLTRISESGFQTRCAETNEHGRIYGGQILGQALYAASQSVSRDRFASCLQLLFAAGGLPDQTIDFEVAALQDGKRFSARNVRGVQGGGRIVCDASVAFAKAMASPDHEAPAPALRRTQSSRGAMGRRKTPVLRRAMATKQCRGTSGALRSLDCFGSRWQ
jgi:acyl-CoA thioesterase II